MMLTFHINIGPKVAACLQEIGINSLQELKDKGVAESYVEMSLLQPEKHLPLCYYLYSLEGAIEQINWRDLSKKRGT